MPQLDPASAKDIVNSLRHMKASQTRLSYYVDVDGLVDPCQITVLLETDTTATAAVVARLPRLRYAPGQMDGVVHKMLVQQVFTTK